MKDAEALAEGVRLDLETWLRRGHLVGEVHIPGVSEEVDLQESKIRIAFPVEISIQFDHEKCTDL